MLLAKLCIAILQSTPLMTSGQPAAMAILGLVLLIDGLLIVAPRLPSFQRQRPHIQHWLILPAAFLSGLSFSGWMDYISDTTAMSAILPNMAVALLAVCLFGNRRLLGVGYFLGAVGMTMMQPASSGQAGLLISCLGVMMILTLRQARADRARALERSKQDAQAQRSDRLLQEYEQSGRGWFWETDRQGCLVYISETLADTLDVPKGGLVGRPITEIIRPGDRQQGDGERTLGFHLSARTTFSDIPVRAAMARDERWWSISGQPVFTEFGQFHGFRGSGTDLTEMRRSQAEVARLAQYDSLTGLANRVQMLSSLEQAVAGMRGAPGDCALMMLDLDRFKQVNDTLGHAAGDEVLKQVAQRLERIVGTKGEIGRLGGDEFQINLPDTNLAYLPEGSRYFDDYVEAVSWAQDFAMENRQLMMKQVLSALQKSGAVPSFTADKLAVNCHHNYVEREHHYGRDVLVTRKGAVRAREGDLGIIPGSMGARSYIVRGKGHPESFCSCSHGAGRVMSRTEAKRRFSVEDHVRATAGIECRKDADVIDETPMAYKDIDAVMEAQKQLVDVVHTLRQVVCVKG